MAIKVVSPFWVEGEMVEEGDVIELPKSQAKALTGTGQAVLAVEADLADGQEVDDESD